MGHVLWAEKGNFLIRGDDAPMVQGGRASGILSIPAGEVSLRSPRVVTIHVQALTPYAPPLPAYFGQFSQLCNPYEHELLANDFPELQAAASMAYAVQATTHYQTYLERPPGADRPPKKVCNLDPMAPRPRQKRQLPEGPQES